jgi:peptidoglycan hydrolase CwlO-like protein
MYKTEVIKMINKREIVLAISLAFCAGVIFSDFTKPKPIEAEVTNIVYDTLDKKINKTNASLSRLASRVSSLESRIDQKDSKIAAMAKTLKVTNQVSKDLAKDILKIQKEIAVIKSMQTMNVAP